MIDFHDQVMACYEANRGDLYAFAVALCGHRQTAEDLVQAAVLSLLSQGRMPRDGRPYLFRCVRNQAVDAYRRRRDTTQAEPAQGSVAPVVVDLDVDRSLARLSTEERATVVLRIWVGLTTREIGRVMGCSVNTVGSWYRRALVKLRAELEVQP